MMLGSVLVTSVGLVTPVAQQLAALETELPVPPLVFGLIAFLCLVVTMAIVLSIGKGRPHS